MIQPATLQNRTVMSNLSSIRELPALSLLSIVLVWLIATKPAFRSLDNLAQVGQEAAFIGIMACGEALVILTGGIDLSVGATLALCACVTGERLTHGSPVWLAVALGLMVGAVGGWLNGALITFRKLPPILTTLASLLIFRSITNIETSAAPFNQLPESFKFLGKGFVPFIVFIVIVAATARLLASARFGRHVVAVGGSEQSARLSGIPVDRVLRIVYLISGLTAGIAGMLMAAASNNAQWNLADGYELEVIAAVVIGGVRLTGGQGSVIGAGLGALIVVVLRNALFLSGIPTERYGLVTGAVILVAALAEQLRRRRQEAAA